MRCANGSLAAVMSRRRLIGQNGRSKFNKPRIPWACVCRTLQDMPERQSASLLVPGHPRACDYVMPPDVAANIQAILDRAARRLLAEDLAEQINAYAARTPSGRDLDSHDEPLDQITSLSERKLVPLGRRV